MTMLHLASLVEPWLCWIVWSLSFVKPRKQTAHQQIVARKSAPRWACFWSCADLHACGPMWPLPIGKDSLSAHAHGRRARRDRRPGFGARLISLIKSKL